MKLTQEQARERYETLEACLDIMTAQLRSFSANANLLLPKKGYEQAFDDTRRKLECIRQMMRTLREKV